MSLTLLALALAVGDGGDSSAAYTFTGDDRTELERGPWQIVGLIRRGRRQGLAWKLASGPGLAGRQVLIGRFGLPGQLRHELVE